MSPWWYHLTLVDVSFLKHTRLGWYCLPLVYGDVAMPMCTSHEWCVQDLPDATCCQPTSFGLRAHVLADTAWCWTMRMSPNWWTHTSNNACMPLVMLHSIRQRRSPNTHMQCHMSVYLGWCYLLLADVSCPKCTSLGLWYLSFSDVVVFQSMHKHHRLFVHPLGCMRLSDVIFQIRTNHVRCANTFAEASCRWTKSLSRCMHSETNVTQSMHTRHN